MHITHATLIADEGTVVVFEGIDHDQPHRRVTFAVDHRIAADILGDDTITGLYVEDWQVLRTRTETMHEHFMNPYHPTEDPITRRAYND